MMIMMVSMVLSTTCAVTTAVGGPGGSLDGFRSDTTKLHELYVVCCLIIIIVCADLFAMIDFVCHAGADVSNTQTMAPVTHAQLPVVAVIPPVGHLFSSQQQPAQVVVVYNQVQLLPVLVGHNIVHMYPLSQYYAVVASAIAQYPQVIIHPQAGTSAMPLNHRQEAIV
jgi:hypothetical protein